MICDEHSLIIICRNTV